MRMVTARGTMLQMAAAIAAVTLVPSRPAHADVAMTGTFTATQTCPAYKSIRKATNPGEAQVEQGKTYNVLAKNKPDLTHYRIRVDGAQPAERWVWSLCGHFAAAGQPASAAASGAAAGAAAGAASGTAAETGRMAGVRATHVLADLRGQ